MEGRDGDRYNFANDCLGETKGHVEGRAVMENMEGYKDRGKQDVENLHSSRIFYYSEDKCRARMEDHNEGQEDKREKSIEAPCCFRDHYCVADNCRGRVGVRAGRADRGSEDRALAPGSHIA